MDLGISGRVAIVTGSSRGNGQAIAAALWREGATVVVTESDEVRLENTCKDLTAIRWARFLGCGPILSTTATQIIW